MRLLAGLLAPALLLAAPGVRPEEPPAADSTATDSAAVAATAAAEAKEELVLPPGFKPKKRGKFILYCRKETPLGTRLHAEKCYDEQGIRAMVRAQAEDREKVDQIRRVCGTIEACGSH